MLFFAVDCFKILVDAPTSFQFPITPVQDGILGLHSFIMIYGVGIIIFVLTLLISIIWIFKNASQPNQAVGEEEHAVVEFREFLHSIRHFKHDTTLEIVWTVIPACILLSIAYPSLQLLYAMDEIIEPTLTVKVGGRQWFWNYSYSDKPGPTVLAAPETQGLVFEASFRQLDKSTVRTYKVNFYEYFRFVMSHVASEKGPNGLYLTKLLDVLGQIPSRKSKSYNAGQVRFLLKRMCIDLNLLKSDFLYTDLKLFSKYDTQSRIMLHPGYYIQAFVKPVLGPAAKALKLSAYFDLLEQRLPKIPLDFRVNEPVQKQFLATFFPAYKLLENATCMLETIRFGAIEIEKVRATLTPPFDSKVGPLVHKEIDCGPLFRFSSKISEKLCKLKPDYFATYAKMCRYLFEDYKYPFTVAPVLRMVHKGTYSYDSYMVPENALRVGEPRLLKVDKPLIVPFGAHIRFLVTSNDVLHSFAIPAAGIKIDAVPGRLNQVSAYFLHEGTFFGQCSELCGVNHGFMPIQITIVSPAQYSVWIGKRTLELGANPYALYWSPVSHVAHDNGYIFCNSLPNSVDPFFDMINNEIPSLVDKLKALQARAAKIYKGLVMDPKNGKVFKNELVRQAGYTWIQREAGMYAGQGRSFLNALTDGISDFHLAVREAVRSTEGMRTMMRREEAMGVASAQRQMRAQEQAFQREQFSKVPRSSSSSSSDSGSDSDSEGSPRVGRKR